MKRNKFFWIILLLVTIGIVLAVLFEFSSIFQNSTNEQNITVKNKQLTQEENISKLELNNKAKISEVNNTTFPDIKKKAEVKIILTHKSKIILEDNLKTYNKIGNFYLKGDFTKQETERITKQLINKKGLFLVEKGDNQITVTLIIPTKISREKISLNTLQNKTFLKIIKNANVYYVDKNISKEVYEKVIHSISKGNFVRKGIFIIMKGDNNSIIVNIAQVNYLTKDTISSSFSNGCERRLTIHFDFNSYDINKSNEPQLNNLKKEIHILFPSQIIINGYTDNIGSKTYNQRLSLKRAKSVSKFLDFNNSKVQGFGEEKPVTSNHTPKERALNRRTEIILCN